MGQDKENPQFPIQLTKMVLPAYGLVYPLFFFPPLSFALFILSLVQYAHLPDLQSSFSLCPIVHDKMQEKRKTGSMKICTYICKTK